MSDVLAVLADVLPPERVVSPAASPLGERLGQVVTGPDRPQAIAFPQTEAELAQVIATAHRREWRLLACGNGTKLTWGGLAQGLDLVVSTARLNQVIDHAIGDMTLTAQAGVIVSPLQAQLAEHQQFLAVDPAYPAQATLGGVVATADTGSRRQRYGGVRDMLIGISFIRYDGQLAKAGGRVVKNVAGYDLMKLMTGAYGTLGVISQLTFRLYPVQETSRTVVLSGPATELRPLMATLGRSPLTPVAFDLLSPALAASLGLKAEFALAIRFQAIAPGVTEQVERLQTLVPEPLTPILLTDQDDQTFWPQIQAALFPDPPTDATAIVVKLGLRPTAVVDSLECLERLAPDLALGCVHATSGIGTVRLTGDLATVAVVEALRSRCQEWGGYLTVLEAPKALKQILDVWGYSGNALPLMQALKDQFDPYRRLSPGRFVGGL